MKNRNGYLLLSFLSLAILLFSLTPPNIMAENTGPSDPPNPVYDSLGDSTGSSQSEIIDDPSTDSYFEIIEDIITAIIS